MKYSYVFLSELEPIPQSGPVDKVVVLKKPYPVKAGDVVAHFGQYQRYREAKLTPPVPNRPLLHLEVFAGSDLPAFIAKSRARAKELPDTDKPFLEVLAGAKLVTKIPDPDFTLEQTGLKLVPVSDPKSRWVKVQPKTVKMPAAQPEPAGPAGKGKKHKEKPQKKQAPIETPTGSPFWVDSSLGLVNQMTTAPVKGWIPEAKPIKSSHKLPAHGSLASLNVQNANADERDEPVRGHRTRKISGDCEQRPPTREQIEPEHGKQDRRPEQIGEQVDGCVNRRRARVDATAAFAGRRCA
ncbi:hypothetical protein [Burkholderia ubonensis]|uniref:hypothetical protein n=1 Tax=Burkholderia ubonensis TaxID=101571 RepID=UPI000A5AB36D|nr:hypothetical protein [Burkholderia ubonensis]